ncbi:HET-domain-containing protein [Thozetella sp. PMI_491]|nr:HET-domain-containing protein [Thozetella sp. PMI_491]
MWLINGSSLQLEYFPSPEDVPYAILSHTWGDDEVSFQDMADLDAASGKAGWAKIEKTCEMAVNDGYSYAWVDTCCIDKSSSAELSEAINSMFLWYLKSAVCYAYLEDLPAAPPNDGSDEWQDPARLRAYLAPCRWFTRGWTLQELVAAKNILFYNSSWDFVASKRFLEPVLADITGVDSIVLEDNDTLPEIPVGKKISWVSRRQTKRVEDMAYCILGILDVNLPPLYGEGSKAFVRLQEELAKGSNDLTLFAWQQSGVDSLIYQFRGIFAHSPSEFQCCSALRTQPTSFDRDSEFTLTNRGVRIAQNLFIPESQQPEDSTHHRIVLSLDCMECSERTEFRPKWVGVSLRRFGAIYLREFPDNFFYFDAWAESRRPSTRTNGEREVAYISRMLTHNNIQDLQGKATVSVICYDRTPHTKAEIPWSISTPYNIHAPRNHIGLIEFPENLCPMTSAVPPLLVFGFQGQFNQLWCMPIPRAELQTEGVGVCDDPARSTAVRAYAFERYSGPSGRLEPSQMPGFIDIQDGTGDSPWYRFTVAVDDAQTPSREISQASTRAGRNVAYSAGRAVISFSCELVAGRP